MCAIIIRPQITLSGVRITLAFSSLIDVQLWNISVFYCIALKQNENVKSIGANETKISAVSSTHKNWPPRYSWNIVESGVK
jgi:hypothetical protein